MRVAIVNDMPLAREVLKRTVLSVPGYSVAWLAENGEQAIRQAGVDHPDAILMDLIMPGIDGVEATRAIMANHPCPILLVTGSVSANFNKVFEAMGHGGLDAVNTPTLGSGGRIVDAEVLLSKLDKIAKKKKTTPTKSHTTLGSFNGNHSPTPPLVLIGASTGGPQAIAKIIAELPADFPGAVLIAQHIEAEFAPNMAKWLQQHSGLRVVTVTPDMEVQSGTIYLACTNDHLYLNSQRRLDYIREPVAYPFRPSVDVLFKSVCQHWPTPGVGVLLTGMGSDGAKGLLQLKQAGWQTIAQEKSSCVVYGMPLAAVELQAANHVLPLERIASTITSLIAKS